MTTRSSNSTDELARRGYNAYGGHTGWKNFRGDTMPQWFDLPQTIRDAWMAAANSIRLGVLDELRTADAEEQPSG